MLQAGSFGVAAQPAEPAAGFVAGTRILTDRGEAAIQDLRVGDLVATLARRDTILKRIGWIGERRLVPALHDRPESVYPIRVRAGALAPDVPRRDLLVSPGHAIVVDGVMIPAGELLNGATIVREETTRSVRYLHVELERRAVLFAEGLGCESYVDAGDRGFFADSPSAPGEHRHLPWRMRQHRSRSGVRDRGQDLARVRRILLDRVAAFGMVAPADADIRLVADGAMLRPSWTDGDTYGFWLKQPSSNIRLVSSSGARSGTGAASDDCRRLGIAVTRIAHRPFDVTAVPVVLALDALDGGARDAGWHEPERDEAAECLWRWTDGAAQLPGFDAGELIVETLGCRAGCQEFAAKRPAPALPRSQIARRSHLG